MLDRLLVFGLALLPLVIAYALYKITFFILQKVVRGEAARRITEALAKPTCALFLILAAFFSVRIALIPQHVEEIVNHVLVVLFIAAIGWALASSTRAFYLHLKDTHKTEALEDFSRRSFLTQSQILYRATMFAILVLTFGSILLTFPEIKNFGIGILGSAGIAGLAIGLAARPILSNLIAGFQIAFTRMLKMGDAVVVEGEYGYVEQIFLTHVIVKTWDLRRVVLPISYFIEKPFQNWSSSTIELLVTVLFPCDYKTPIEELRKKFDEILQASPYWNKKVARVEVINFTEQTMHVRFLMSIANPADSTAFQSSVREQMIAFLQTKYPQALPRIRYLVEEVK